MSDCCSSTPGFPTAGQMEQLALNHPTIWQEICAIQQAILRAASQCQPGGGRMCTVVGGNTPMTFVGGVRAINATEPGSGYYQDTPSIALIPPNGVDITTPAVVAAVTNGGAITSVNITEPGLGYAPVSATVEVSSVDGVGAILRPFVNSMGTIIGIDIVDGGLGYKPTDSVYVTRAVSPNAAYTNAVIRVTSVSPVGRIMTVAVENGGTGYQQSVTTARIVSSLSPGLPYPAGMGFDATVYTDAAGAITQIAVNNSGTGYTALPPRVVISDVGTGAVAKANISGDGIASVVVEKPGVNYTEGATATVINPVTAASTPVDYAQLSLDVAINTYGTTPELYYKVWAGTVTDKQIQTQITTVISYFTRLGYSIVVQSNPNTGSTIQWKICW